METDSGISVNLSHFDPELSNRSRQDQGVTVAQIINGKLVFEGHKQTLILSFILERASPPRLSLPPPPPPPVGLSFAIREQFEEEFCDWYEPGKGKKKTHSRRKSSTRSLHQKLVVSKNNVKKETKIDMEDRAKMLQYFSNSNDDSQNISLHDLFKGVCAFIHSFVENKISTDDSEDVECTELCPCRTLQTRARADRCKHLLFISHHFMLRVILNNGQ
jgi:hypothetical protein